MKINQVKMVKDRRQVVLLLLHLSNYYLFSSTWKPLLLARVKSRNSLQMVAEKLYLKKKGASAFWSTNTAALQITSVTITSRWV